MTDGLKLFLTGVVCGSVGSTLILYLLCCLIVGDRSDPDK